MVAGSDVTDSLHAAAVDRIVSAVARIPEVRGALLRLQRDIVRASAATGIIMAGRDIGSVVLPDADLKLYLDVSLDERARRRAEQRGLRPGSAEARHIRDELARRDAIDSTRAASPLVVPQDARIIPTDGHTLDRTITQVVSLIRAAEAAGA
jgi:CMP/dCMP kinase